MAFFRKSFATFAVLALVACASDDGDENTSDTIVAEDNTATTETSHFTANIRDFQTKVGVEEISITVLNNDNGDPLDLDTWPTFLSGEDGQIELDLPADKDFAIKTFGKATNATYKDTYMFNIDSTVQNEVIYAVNVITYKTAPSPALLKLDATKGVLAGTVYWVNASGEEEMVGCVTLEAIPIDDETADSQGDIRYFSDKTDMPAPLSQAPHTTKITSRYLAGNVPEGMYRLIAKIDGKQVNMGDREVTLRSYKDSICISNIYVEDPDNPGVNPTPDREECQGQEHEDL